MAMQDFNQMYGAYDQYRDHQQRMMEEMMKRQMGMQQQQEPQKPKHLNSKLLLTKGIK